MFCEGPDFVLDYGAETETAARRGGSMKSHEKV